MRRHCNVPYCNAEADFRGKGPDGETLYVCGLHSIDSDTYLGGSQ